MSDTLEATDGRRALAAGLAVGLLVVVHLGALLAFTAEATPGQIAAVEGVAGVAVGGAILAGGERLRWALTGALAASVGSAVTWSAVIVTGADIWQVALPLAVVAASLSYGLHRYEMLVLGLLEDTQ